MIKVVSVYLISKVVDSSGNPVNYKDVYKILWKLQDETRMLKNKAVQLCWEWYGFCSDFYKKNNSQNKIVEHPDTVSLLGYKGSHALANYISKTLNTNNVKLIQSKNLVSTVSDVTAHYKADKEDYRDGKKSIASYKEKQPIDLSNQCIKLNYNDDDKIFSFTLSLLNQIAMKEYGINRFDFECIAKENYTRTILERCYDNIYGISASKLIYDKKKKMWKLNLCYKFENEKNYELDKNKILGIDLGYSKPFVASIYGKSYGFWTDDKKVKHFYQRIHQIEERRNTLLKQTKFCGDGRIGHGTKTRCKPANDIGDKIHRMRDTINHIYSREIINYAIENNCGTIQMEELKGATKDDKFLSAHWDYCNLQLKITYKAQEYGIKVVKVDPAYTSQRCSKCGYISPGNRPHRIDENIKQDVFACLRCGYGSREKINGKDNSGRYVNADYNASQNLAIKDIDKVIEEYCKDNFIPKVYDCEEDVEYAIKEGELTSGMEYYIKGSTDCLKCESL